MGLHVKKGLLDKLINRFIPKEITKKNDMENCEWVQFSLHIIPSRGSKVLHAVKVYKGFRDNEAICGRWTPLPFFEPQIKISHK